MSSLSVQAAAYLDLAHGNGDRCENARKITELIEIRLQTLQTRMGAAFECGCAGWLMKILQKPDAQRLIYGTAYFRDVVVQTLFTIRRFTANQCGNDERAGYIAKLRDFWEHVDKGDLAQSGPEREALIFLRRLHLYEKCAPGRSEKQRTKEQAELSKFLLNAVKNEQCDFELALAKAKQFRSKRLSARRIDEGDLRADLVFRDVLANFFGERLPDSEKLMAAFDPARYATLQVALKRGARDKAAKEKADNIKRNWRKLLRQCGVWWEGRGWPGRRKMGTASE